ncbi:MAG TPA: tetratricopeptide repeat protein [Stenotrophomonas sp.]|nr:tetratricopeptide repeat protein [Stenotrophomonas sp.]
MSLMFAALRTLDGERPAPAAATAPGRRLGAALWPAGLWLGAGVLLGGAVVAWSAAPLAAPPTPPSLPTMAPVAAVVTTTPAAAPVTPTAPPATAAPAPVVAAAPTPTPTDPVATATPPAMPTPAAVAPVTAPPAHGFAPLPAGSLVVRDAAPAAARDADEPDAAAVARHVDALGSAIESGDFDKAQSQLQQLQHLLPPRSLTLLRMQAWLAQRRGNVEQALPLYREIVERMPGDRGAAINLALLEAGSGQLDEARQRLRQLQGNDNGASDNERQALARAVAEVGATP